MPPLARCNRRIPAAGRSDVRAHCPARGGRLLFAGLALGTLVSCSNGNGAPGGIDGAGGGGSRTDGGTGPSTTGFDLTSVVGGAQTPFTVGLGFRMSEVPIDFALDLDTAQVEIKRRWNNGSVKHAVVSGHVDLAPGQPRRVKIVGGSYSGGTKLSCADIQTAAPRASVSLGTFGSADLGALLTSPVRTWLSGTEAVECHYRAKVGSDPTLRVWYHVRLYRRGRISVRAVVENGYLDVQTVDKTYVPVVTIDGVATMASSTPLTHYAHTRWFAEAWIGGDPQLVPGHDIPSLVGSRLVPNYKQKTATPAALSALYETYKPMESGTWTPRMGEAGFQDQIGLLPNWDALYVTSDGDARAFRASLANAKALNSYPLVWRDSQDDRVTSPSARPTWSVNGEAQGGETGVGAGPLAWDNAHHGSGGYLAYLISGDYLFLETMQMQSSLAYLVMSSAHGSGRARILRGQTRAMAWANRTIGQYAAVAPLDAVSEDYRGLLAENAAYWKGVVASLADKHLGLVYSYELSSNAYGDGVIAPWQQNFTSQVFGHVSDLEPLADMTAWNAVRDYAYQFPVGLLGGGGSGGFCFTRASQYTVKVADVPSDTLEPTYASWGTVYEKMFGAAPCENTLLGTSGGSPESASTGYWGNLMPAIALAVDHEAPGAAAAWARLTGASNYSAVASSGFEKVPVWGVVPR